MERRQQKETQRQTERERERKKNKESFRAGRVAANVHSFPSDEFSERRPKVNEMKTLIN